MMNTLRLVSRRNVHQLRQFHKCIARRAEAAAATVSATEPLPVPPSTTETKPVSAKIDKIANDITALNLLEVAELSELLKKRLNLPDTPMMPMGGFALPSQAEDAEEQTPKAVQTAFTVKLMSFDDKQKVALIKEIKSLLPNTNLVQAKKFVESAPAVVRSDVSKEEAEQLKVAIMKVGGTVEIV